MGVCLIWRLMSQVKTNPLIVNVTECSSINIGVSIDGVQGPIGPSGSSSSNFYFNVPSGFGIYGVLYPNSFENIPFVQATLQIPSGSNNLYGWATQNINKTGFNLIFSETIQETGLVLNVKCN